jgi:hypothetical protein
VQNHTSGLTAGSFDGGNGQKKAGLKGCMSRTCVGRVPQVGKQRSLREYGGE